MESTVAAAVDPRFVVAEFTVVDTTTGNVVAWCYDDAMTAVELANRLNLPDSLRRLLVEEQAKHVDLLNRLACMRRIADLAATAWLATGPDDISEDESLLLVEFIEATTYLERLPVADSMVDAIIKPLLAATDQPEFDLLQMAVDGINLRHKAAAELAELRDVEPKLDEAGREDCRAMQATLVYLLDASEDDANAPSRQLLGVDATETPNHGG